MNKITQNFLTNKEKNRHQNIAYFFSKGAALELHNKIKNEAVEKFKKQFEKFQSFSNDKKDEETVRKNNIKSEALKFIAIGTTVTALGYLGIKKLKDLYETHIEQITTKLYISDENEKTLSDEIDEKVNKSTSKLHEDFANPVKKYVAGALGLKPELLMNSQYNKVKGGPLGVVLPVFSIMSMIYVFRKLGHQWFLDILNIKNPDNLDIIIGMWDYFRMNRRSFYTTGNQNVISAELGNASSVQMGWEKYKDNITTFLTAATSPNASDFVVNLFAKDFSDYEINHNLDAIVEVISFYSDKNRLLQKGLQFKDVVGLNVTGIKKTSYDFGEEVGTITLTVFNKNFSEVPFDDEVDGWVEKERRVIKPESFLWINGMYKETISMYNQWSTNSFIHKFSDVYKVLTSNDGDAYGDGEWWNAKKLAYMIQMYIAMSSWLAYQQLNSEASAMAFYNEELNGVGYDIMLTELSKRIKEDAQKPAPWEIEYAQGKIDFDELLKNYINDMKNTISKGFLSSLKEILKIDILKYQKQLKGVKIKDSLKGLELNLQKILLQLSKRRSVSTISMQDIKKTLRPRYNTLNGVSDNIKGWNKKAKLFNKVPVKNTKQNILSGSSSFLGLTDYVKVSFWKKTFWGNIQKPYRVIRAGETSSLGANNFHKWMNFNKSEWIHEYNEDKKGASWSIYDGGGRNGYGTGWDDKAKQAAKANEYYNPQITSVKLGTIQEERGRKIEGGRRLTVEEVVGFSKEYAYEYIDEDDNIGIVYLREYYENDNTLLLRQFIKEEKSEYSDAAKFKEMLVNNDESYTTEQKMKILMNSIDYVEKEKKILLQERYEILSEIINKLDSKDKTLYLQRIS